jgi:(p)ppGpp synthase/HD superfamily hydrolase
VRHHWSQDLYVETYTFAAHAHQGQKVPGSDLPYLVHVSLVSVEVIAALDAETGYDEDLAVQCALLHDVIEDTGTAYEQVQEAFGTAVAAGVLALSKDPALDKADQMPDSLRRIRQQPHEVWVVKLADRIENLRAPPHYWTVDRMAGYREEAIEICEALGAASPYLVARLERKIEAYRTYMQ